MVDPVNFTNFKLDKYGLQEYALFCLMVFNKNADQTSVKLERFLNWCHEGKRTLDHFEAIRHRLIDYDAYGMVDTFKFGNTTVKSQGLEKLVNAGLDLRQCSLKAFESIPGFKGMKTSRYFVLHTRAEARVACLDTHVLQWLSYYTNEAIPKQTPAKKRYLELEQMFLNIADAMEIHPAVLDLRIWNKQRGSDRKSHL